MLTVRIAELGQNLCLDEEHATLLCGVSGTHLIQAQRESFDGNTHGPSIIISVIATVDSAKEPMSKLLADDETISAQLPCCGQLRIDFALGVLEGRGFLCDGNSVVNSRGG